MVLSTLVLNAAYVALLVATFTRTLNWLRAMLVLASIAFITFGAVVGLKSMVLWNIATGGLHLYRIVRDYRQQQSVTLTEEEQALRDEFFPKLTDFDFHLLWCMGEEASLSNEVIIRQGTRPEFVALVLDGVVLVTQTAGIARGLRRGGLVGEMSFVSGEVAQVSVETQGYVKMRKWDQRRLASMEQLHPASFRAFQDLMSRDLVAKARL